VSAAADIPKTPKKGAAVPQVWQHAGAAAAWPQAQEEEEEEQQVQQNALASIAQKLGVKRKREIDAAKATAKVEAAKAAKDAAKARVIQEVQEIIASKQYDCEPGLRGTRQLNTIKSSLTKQNSACKLLAEAFALFDQASLPMTEATRIRHDAGVASFLQKMQDNLPFTLDEMPPSAIAAHIKAVQKIIDDRKTAGKAASDAKFAAKMAAKAAAAEMGAAAMAARDFLSDEEEEDDNSAADSDESVAKMPRQG
jgi:hypothetical protein